MEFLIVGIAVAFNLAIIKWKIDKSRYLDASLDFASLAAITFFFSGSYGALVVGTVGSALFSLYLLVSPPKWSFND